MLTFEQRNNTVNIDIARIRYQGSASTKQKKRPITTIKELHRYLVLRLQTSLEIARVLEIFFEEVRGYIPLDALRYQNVQDDVVQRLGNTNEHTASYRLDHHDEYLGELSLERATPFSASEIRHLEELLCCLLFPLRNALMYRRAIKASLQDPLTGVGNRVALKQSLIREIELARRHGQPLSLIMLDMDHFKNLNDNFGHHFGDQALKAVAATLNAQLRNVDIVFRFGGEEFVLLLANTDSDAAALVGERIRAAIENLPLLVNEQPVRLSVSLGCAVYRSGESQEDLLQRTDQALYAAKRAGRNRIHVAA